MATLDVSPLDLTVESPGWLKSRLHKAGEFVMNYAALLCLLDCIVLPVLITLFRLLDVFKGFRGFEGPFHLIEVVCVVTLGLLAVVVNYRKGGKARYAALGVTGIVLVVCGHYLVDGWVETCVSLAGCAMLLSSNHLSRRNHGCSHCHLPVAL
ncbi:uncharacterized protein BXIN_1168 [Babesia sp. Xinjiang]|uniref:uncharacterized protein n=1 Tax=Babesia sp. Xinjiang TaxID=462227 RepID=UPI000A266657|nr:uncharacterized protein BXIN_1168 [Babesia sp. Xinjiang]ORM40167.1 hypothetical protein BXIN_1168 [Babesia sp. Xinjiang]